MQVLSDVEDSDISQKLPLRSCDKIIVKLTKFNPLKQKALEVHDNIPKEGKEYYQQIIVILIFLVVRRNFFIFNCAYISRRDNAHQHTRLSN